MSEEEKKAIERQFEMALDTIISKIKGETATAIVHSEQPMILLFKKLVYTIEKQQKEIEELKEKTKKCEYYEMVADELSKEIKEERKKYPIAMNDEQYRKVIELAQKDIKDKIKAKIEEYNKMINATYDDLTHYGDCRRDVCIEIKNILQSLLKEE